MTLLGLVWDDEGDPDFNCLNAGQSLCQDPAPHNERQTLQYSSPSTKERNTEYSTILSIQSTKIMQSVSVDALQLKIWCLSSFRTNHSELILPDFTLRS